MRELCRGGHKALRANGIEVTAIYSHTLVEQPRLIFMHFWANDDAVQLAKGLRAARTGGSHAPQDVQHEAISNRNRMLAGAQVSGN